MWRADETRDDGALSDGLIAAWLRGEAPAISDMPANLPERVLYHGVSGLLVARPAAMAALLGPMRDVIRQQALAEAMWDMQHRRILAPLLEDLARAGIATAVLKGTALACSVYPSPALRPRGDTDLLVGEPDVPRVRQLLERHGFRRSSEHLADRMPQEEWVLSGPEGRSDCIDLHWNLLRPWALSELFDTDDLLASTRALPKLSPAARMLSLPLALLHACLHRASHVSGAYFVGSQVYYGGDRLIWLTDIDLLARGLTESDWDMLVRSAVKTDSSRIVHEALVQSAAVLGTPVDPSTMTQLASRGDKGKAETYFIGASLLRRLWADMRALPQGQSRLAFLREITFPPAHVMRKDFPQLAHLPLYRLHLYRFAQRLKRLRQERQQRRSSP
jgi:hypothetical protein